MKFPSVSNITDSIFPGMGSFLGRGSSPSGGDSGAAAAADEARKAALRARIDALYGIGPAMPVPNTPASGGERAGGGGLLRAVRVPMDFSPEQQGDVELATTSGNARTSMDAERTQLSDATRQYYTDQLARSFGAAERNTRFQLARQGLLGGSVNTDKNAELQTDENLGATRIDEAARRAAAQLDAQREQERMSAISLVNSGAGESAVSSAQAGLRNSLQNVSTQNKASLFNDLFAASANSVTAANDPMAIMAAMYGPRLAAYFPTGSTSSGRVTPSGPG